MLLWILPVAGGALVLFLYGRYNLAAVMHDWEMMLTPSGRRALATLGGQVELDAVMADQTYAAARAARGRADYREAVRLLDLSLSVVGEAVPDRLSRLRAIAVCSRMASAIMPTPPLSARAFRLPALSAGMGIGGMLHYLAVNTRDAFALRLHLLAWAFRLVFWHAARAASTAREDARPEAPWSEFADGLADFKTLDREHVEAFKVLMMSLAASPRLAPLAEIE